jgi:hypothetical protein
MSRTSHRAFPIRLRTLCVAAAVAALAAPATANAQRP